VTVRFSKPDERPFATLSLLPAFLILPACSGMLSAITEIPTQAQLIAKMAAERAMKASTESYNQVKR